MTRIQQGITDTSQAWVKNTGEVADRHRFYYIRDESFIYLSDPAMQRLFILTVLLSILFISCGGPRVVVHDQHSAQTLSSSPSASATATGEASGSDTSTEQDQSATFVMMTSLPELKGGNRALRKKITYPDQAIQNNIEGVVRVQFKIDGQGEPTDFVVREEIGYGCDEAVIRAIRDSEFTPGRGPEGSTVNFLWEVTAEFKL